MDFLPEPFYFPSVALVDYALRYKSKAGRKGTLTSGLDLDEDGQWIDVRNTYKKIRLTTYHHSVPVQELLKEHRWEAFQNGIWGNRPNPDIPEGHVRPTGGAIAAGLDPVLALSCPQSTLQTAPPREGARHHLHHTPCARLFPLLTAKRQPRRRWN